MPGEKRKVSNEIVKVIETRAQEYIEQVDHGQSEQLEEAMASYQASVVRFYQEKLERLKDKEHALENKEISAMQFQINCDLKRYRNELLLQFKGELKAEIQAFTSNKQAYQKYLNDCLESLETGGIVYVRAQDSELIKGFEVNERALTLGGLVYELGNRVYDYSFETRFENAIKNFIMTSKIWIRSDEN